MLTDRRSLFLGLVGGAVAAVLLGGLWYNGGHSEESVTGSGEQIQQPAQCFADVMPEEGDDPIIFSVTFNAAAEPDYGIVIPSPDEVYDFTDSVTLISFDESDP